MSFETRILTALFRLVFGARPGAVFDSPVRRVMALCFILNGVLPGTATTPTRS
ncbi:hypothetical protein PVW51_01220 [Sulfitobacter sp. PR48]|uniref:hypothetical protein n=1 Tax=Sulfitobacter sp. PR48 TaxID=3028383 RepID=UPI00237A3181|nr:hypothetical protein [Sulfitobacter sp. PR48]MDD9719286.1 hypothetical protein [Sulfitobacter sp. PR48]